MRDEVRILVAAVEHGVLDADEALAKEYLTEAERARLRATLADAE